MNKYTSGVLLFVTVLSSVSSFETNWLSAMKICENSDFRPATTEDIVTKDTWIGEAKYILEWGEVYLRVEAVNRSRTCNITNAVYNMDACEFSDISNLAIKSTLNKIRYLTTNRKYIIAYFRDIAEITAPQRCLVKTANQTTRFDICKQEHDYGCQKKDKLSDLKITLETKRYSCANEMKMNGRQLLIIVMILFGKTSLL